MAKKKEKKKNPIPKITSPKPPQPWAPTPQPPAPPGTVDVRKHRTGHECKLAQALRETGSNIAWPFHPTVELKARSIAYTVEKFSQKHVGLCSRPSTSSVAPPPTPPNIPHLTLRPPLLFLRWLAAGDCRNTKAVEFKTPTSCPSTQRGNPFILQFDLIKFESSNSPSCQSQLALVSSTHNLQSGPRGIFNLHINKRIVS